LARVAVSGLDDKRSSMGSAAARRLRGHRKWPTCGRSPGLRHAAGATQLRRLPRSAQRVNGPSRRAAIREDADRAPSMRSSRLGGSSFDTLALMRTTVSWSLAATRGAWWLRSATYRIVRMQSPAIALSTSSISATSLAPSGALHRHGGAPCEPRRARCRQASLALPRESTRPGPPLHSPPRLPLCRRRGCDGSTAARGARRPRGELSGPAFVPGDTAQDSCEQHFRISAAQLHCRRGARTPVPRGQAHSL
jgi:hypothetical protein